MDFPDQVFCIRDEAGEPEWRAIVNGELVHASWLDRGAALAGMQTEQRRQLNKELSA